MQLYRKYEYKERVKRKKKKTISFIFRVKFSLELLFYHKENDGGIKS